MKILWVKADKRLSVESGGNLRTQAGDRPTVQRNFVVGNGETVFCGEPGSGARGMKKKRGLCGHRR